MRKQFAGLWQRLQLEGFAIWLAQPVKASDLDIRDQLQQTLVGHTSMLLFAGTGVLSLAIAYAALQNLFIGGFLILLSVLSTIQRVLSDRAVSRAPETIGQNCQIIITVGLIWTTVTTVITDMCVVSGQPFLIVLASCVSTGVAFGAAFNNAAAPRFPGLSSPS